MRSRIIELISHLLAAALFNSAVSAAEVNLQQTPDLQWQPAPFNTRVADDGRYIDFQNGDDNNPGSKDLPWKHHPWDSDATGLVKDVKGISTYFFKKGVIYRGMLTARESGSRERPIRLTTDESWGVGEAIMSGAQALIGGWSLCTEKEQQLFPQSSQGKIWCHDIESKHSPRLAWERLSGTSYRIPIARAPNWTASNPLDPHADWYELEGSLAVQELDVENTRGLAVGDRVWQGKWKTVLWVDDEETRRQPYKILAIEGETLTLEVPESGTIKLEKGSSLTNGESITSVSALGSSHEVMRRLIDSNHNIITSSASIEGATVWVEKAAMPLPVAGIVEQYEAKEGAMLTNLHLKAGRGPEEYSRYYLEGAPALLDVPGEYYYREGSGKEDGTIYLRLPEDRNPNNSLIELAKNEVLLLIQGKNFIEVSGLSFQYSNQVKPGTDEALHAPMHASAIQLRGDVTNVSIHHNRFSNLSAGVIGHPLLTGRASVMDNIDVSDNIFEDIDGAGIALGNGMQNFKAKNSGSRLIHVDILRNSLERVGLRVLGHWGLGSKGDGIIVSGGEVVEVAGNHVSVVGGSGITVFTGADYELGHIKRPFLRSQIHHNKVVNSVLLVQDYGGIASWRGGPSYVYNNISGNPVGYIHSKTRKLKEKTNLKDGSYGVGIYLDSQYKAYLFNNIIWGHNGDISQRNYNAAGINEAMGFMNIIFNNTISTFAVGSHKGMYQHNRCVYVGNLFHNMGQMNFQHEVKNSIIDYETLAFSGNVFSGKPKYFGQIGYGEKRVFSSLDEMKFGLFSKGAYVSDVGVLSEKNSLVDTKTLNFNPTYNSAVVDKSDKVFVPWALSRVVGEWHFIELKKNPELVQGENINMNAEWVNREMLDDVPRNNLQCRDITNKNYIRGDLEGWANGALTMSGGQYCFQSNKDSLAAYEWQSVRTKKSGKIASADRDNTDIETENFIVEAVLRLNSRGSAGSLISKGEKTGYFIKVDKGGVLELVLKDRDYQYSTKSAVPLEHGTWHHVLMEVDRAGVSGPKLYIDGIVATGETSGVFNPSVNLSNSSDFRVGGNSDTQFSWSIDFLRVAKGSLSDSETDIKELYAWQFDGPFLSDFNGRSAVGESRDAGALEYLP